MHSIKILCKLKDLVLYKVDFFMTLGDSKQETGSLIFDGITLTQSSATVALSSNKQIYCILQKILLLGCFK